jgi:hypothetical protein
MSFTHMSNTTDQKVSLSLGDLQAVMNLIDLSSSRGTFRANELEGVGRLYNHLGIFIKQTQESLEGDTDNNADNANNEGNETSNNGDDDTSENNEVEQNTEN